MVTATFITADIVGSTILTEKEMAGLRRVLEDILAHFGCKFEFFRFDSFQALHRDPVNSLKMALQLRCAVRSFGEKPVDVRMNLTLGNISAEIGSLALSKEEVLVLSGRHFDQMSVEGRKFEISLSKEIPECFVPGFDTIARFSEFLVERMTGKQVNILFWLLEGLSQKDITLKLEKRPSTINKHVKALEWKEIQQIILNYQALIGFCNQ